MATTSLLSSSAASFHGRLPSLPPHLNARVTYGSRNGVVSVRATGDVVLVDKSEAEKSNRLKTTFLEKIVPLLIEEFSYTNIHQVPKIQKVVVNCGIGDAAQNAKGLDAAINDLALITGQRPVKTRARNSVATFKIREGQPLGIAVTLRGNGVVVFEGALRKMILKINLSGEAAWLMYSFLDRLVNLGLPRTRDFQGVTPNSFDGHGNYSIGIRDQSVFPEIRFDAVGKARGMDVCIATTANTDQEAQRLLALMGMPFREGGGGGGAAAQPRKKKLKAHHFDSKSKGRSRR
ncbi:hypothetical protein POTOM_010436 [Populus tomentosa]|uniref:Large ribosomal subunit protein uL5c n=1 Tax=Populus tomentosa TaxID=118781 RepID=A0A8X8APU8_POPTO|nr:hypothetical protein POTOM_010436 [Populus tomentosa]